MKWQYLTDVRYVEIKQVNKRPPFEYRTIWQMDTNLPFKYQTSLVFRCLLCTEFSYSDSLCNVLALNGISASHLEELDMTFGGQDICSIDASWANDDISDLVEEFGEKLNLSQTNNLEEDNVSILVKHFFKTVVSIDLFRPLFCSFLYTGVY